MDVDSTFITGEVIEYLAAHNGSQDHVARITEAAMRGEMDFAQSLTERVAALAGLPESVFEEVLASLEMTPGAADLVARAHKRGWAVGLVSGGFIEIVEPLAEQFGITLFRANRLEVVDGVLTGRTRGEIVDRAAKARLLREFANTESIPMSATIAIGDGANDLDMIAAAGVGIAFNAKPVVRDQAAHVLEGPLDEVLDLVDSLDP